ncbi:alpha/beta-type small acid-soluble spore protein [Desulfallas sp. Bu1-1]|uniref:alpha/beta-type small acid-soluble spore protein n=1 Tax=Desulfallas sp. Bu1-1 TaxID=2787620 RepID=UPI0018A1065B|nr:alpha/beta-type small acid-soluble spore protein [Desulfallas sp. Bu1-1]MBF7084489.1 alpha/beta-type small acid-soluble spore protein [Desulfallas sp. Bu1-1]
MENNVVPVTNYSLPELFKVTSATGLVPGELQPYVNPALEEFKNEMAAELGMPDYAHIDKGELSSRQNGKVGGGMTRKMVAFAEAVLAWHYRNKMLGDAANNHRELLPE